MYVTTLEKTRIQIFSQFLKCLFLVTGTEFVRVLYTGWTEEGSLHEEAEERKKNEETE